MNSANNSQSASSTAASPDGTDADSVGVPLLRCWPAVYIVVTIIFIFWVVLLTTLSRAFA